MMVNREVEWAGECVGGFSGYVWSRVVDFGLG